MPLITDDLIDKELKAILRAGGYTSEKAVVGHALELLLTANPALRLDVAIELFHNAEITLARASEISGVGAETFKAHLHKRGIERIVDVSPEDVASGVDNITRFRESDA